MKEPDDLPEDLEALIQQTLDEMLAEAQAEPAVLKLPKAVVEVLATYEKEHSVRREDMFALALEAQKGREEQLSETVARLTEDPSSFQWPLGDPLLCLLLGFALKHAQRWNEKTVEKNATSPGKSAQWPTRSSLTT